MNDSWPISTNLREVKTSECPILLEQIHRQGSMTDEVPLANLNHGAKVGNALPGRMQ